MPPRMIRAQQCRRWRMPEVDGAAPLDQEAVQAYERILEAGTYTPEGGTSWTFRGVRDGCGVAAAEAFIAAGGNAAFVTSWDEAKRRERFIAAYAETARCAPETRLLPAGKEQKALPAGDHYVAAGEAAGLVRAIAALPEAEATVPRPKGATIVHADERRLDELRRQRDAILAEPVGESA